MPTYDYRCNVCSFEFELFQSMHDEPCDVCPRCEGTVVRIISGGAGIIFKGSGFYKTDSAKEPKKGSTQSANSTSESVPKATEKTDGDKSA